MPTPDEHATELIAWIHENYVSREHHMGIEDDLRGAILRAFRAVGDEKWIDECIRVSLTANACRERYERAECELDKARRAAVLEAEIHQEEIAKIRAGHDPHVTQSETLLRAALQRREEELAKIRAGRDPHHVEQTEALLRAALQQRDAAVKDLERARELVRTREPGEGCTIEGTAYTWIPRDEFEATRKRAELFETKYRNCQGRAFVAENERDDARAELAKTREQLRLATQWGDSAITGTANQFKELDRKLRECQIHGLELTAENRALREQIEIYASILRSFGENHPRVVTRVVTTGR